ncbi:DNA-formamidopyrimidine glycosylase [Erythrobacter litoralis]|uniref:DNA-formamidopyrimidine glycosylase family protein n=1 Tax=Erythrobacter litoralis TaxID=39960 RepID=UPI0024359220|nr:DNA-formamidopyrimidine glycosylase family protein [Erythrobacter litoralis]MDG6079694.1 DNA-formamidopyrimidine glycosylase [Erythrobacter litoralis]
MPELPENEAQRLTLERECLNRTIEKAELGDDVSYIELPGSNELGRLKGRQFTETWRHGKNVFAGSKSGPWITVHLGMTGWLIPFDAPDDTPDHTKLLITFEGDRRLAFRCPRKLGHVRVIDDPGAYIGEQGFGPDALDIAKDAFCKVVGSTRGAIKSALMSQDKLAGIGNLWSDEILFRIGVGPERRANELSDDELEDTFDTMRELLKKGVDVEADYAKLPDTWLIRKRDEGGGCPRRGCGGTIRRTKVGGRSAYHCDTHQS